MRYVSISPEYKNASIKKFEKNKLALTATSCLSKVKDMFET